MALIVLAADKGAPGVTTAATALGAVWPRPVLLAECDPSGGDLAYRLPGEDGGVLNPGRGLLSLLGYLMLINHSGHLDLSIADNSLSFSSGFINQLMVLL